MMSETKMKSANFQSVTEEETKSKLSTNVAAGLQNKKVQVSLVSIAAIAACGAFGYALSRPSNRQRISRYADQISGYLPGISQKTSRTERLANQIVDLVEAAIRR